MAERYLKPGELADYLEEHQVPPDVVSAVVDRFTKYDLPRQIIERAKLNGQGELRWGDMDGLDVKKGKWIWRDEGETIMDERQWLPLVGMSLLAGRESTGKSTWTYRLAAMVTRGELPGDLYGEPRNVVICATEDEPAYTILPRLLAHGADRSRCILPSRAVRFPDDLALVEDMVREVEPAMMILDPILGTIPVNLDSHKDAEVRAHMEPLTDLAHRHQLAVLGVIHFNKSGGKDLVNRVMGSRAFGAVARSILMCVKEPGPDGAKYFLGQAKSNLGPEVRQVIPFTIQTTKVGTDVETGEDVHSSVIITEDPMDQTLDQVVDQVEDTKRGPAPVARNAAMDWLRARLADGPVPATQIVEEGCQELDISDRTLKAAKRELGVKSTKEGLEGWHWVMPSQD